MSKLPIDLSKFKKVASDDKSSTLQHADGHKLIVAHVKLSPKLRAELEKIPMIGAKKMAQGGPVQKFNNGGQAYIPLPNGGADLDLSRSNGYVPPAQPQADAPAPAVADDDSGDDNSADNSQPAQPPTQDQSNTPATPAQTSQLQDLEGDDSSEPAQPDPLSAQTNYQSLKAQDFQKLQDENVKWQQDLANQHITPETYADLFGKKDTLGKIGSIFGLLLSGAGSGLAHQSNMAMQMMDNEVQRDFEAQKNSKANAQNFLRLEQARALNDANVNKTNAETSAITFANGLNKTYQTTYHQLVQQVDKMPEGPQKQQATQMLGMMYNKIGEKIANINDQAAGASAFAKMLYGNNNPGQSSEQQFQQQMVAKRMVGGEKIAEDQESKHFPGIPGQASIPLGGDDRAQINSGLTFQNQLDRFMDWTQNHSGDLSPSDKKEGQALAAGLQGAYRQATHGGVYKAGEQDFISSIIDSDPTKFFNSIRVMPSLKAVKQDSAAQLDQLLKSKGFQGFPGYTQSQPQYKTVNGVKYMRGPDGKAIPVK